MIQEMVKKGEEKLAKAARQSAQLQEVDASCKLLSDMLDQLDIGRNSTHFSNFLDTLLTFFCLINIIKSLLKFEPSL